MGQGGTVRTNNVTLSMDKLQKIHPSTKIDMIPGFLKGEKGIGGFPNLFLKFTPYQAKTFIKNVVLYIQNQNKQELHLNQTFTNNTK